MKTFVVLLSLATCLSAHCSPLGDRPHGTLLEMHSCEVYAGGCIVSSESTQGGRYLLRAWNFAGGTFQGMDLAGLKVALLQVSHDNLAEHGTAAGHSVAYLPDSASPSQREALVAWLKSTEPGLSSDLQVRVAPVVMETQSSSCRLSVGKLLSVQTVSLDSCPTGSCGEALWYQPRSATDLFTVAVNERSTVSEPLLKLKWDDSSKKSVFLAKFGTREPAGRLYVSLTDLCGPTGKLF